MKNLKTQSTKAQKNEFLIKKFFIVIQNYF